MKKIKELPKNKLRERLEDYLFDTNLRWSFIHTKIVNRFPISVDQKHEYEEVFQKTVDLFKPLNTIEGDKSLTREKVKEV